MAVLNVRNVPDVLMQRIKSEAALSGVTLREFVVRVLSGDRVVEAVVTDGATVGTEGVEIESERKYTSPKERDKAASAPDPKPAGRDSTPGAHDPSKPKLPRGVTRGMPKTCEHGKELGGICMRCGGEAHA